MEIRPLADHLQPTVQVVGAHNITTLAARAETPATAPTAAHVNQALEKINQAAQKLGSNVEFSVDIKNQHVVVKVINQDTHEVIRQMPTLEALEIAKSIDRSQGLVIRDTA